MNGDERDVLRSPINSDGEEGPNFPEFNEERDINNPQLEIPYVKQFRSLLREYHLKEEYGFKCLKNEKDRVTGVCSKSVALGKLHHNTRVQVHSDKDYE